MQKVMTTLFDQFVQLF